MLRRDHSPPPATFWLITSARTMPPIRFTINGNWDRLRGLDLSQQIGTANRCRIPVSVPASHTGIPKYLNSSRRHHRRRTEPDSCRSLNSVVASPPCAETVRRNVGEFISRPFSISADPRTSAGTRHSRAPDADRRTGRLSTSAGRHRP